MLFERCIETDYPFNGRTRPPWVPLGYFSFLISPELLTDIETYVRSPLYVYLTVYRFEIPKLQILVGDGSSNRLMIYYVRIRRDLWVRFYFCSFFLARLVVSVV